VRRQKMSATCRFGKTSEVGAIPQYGKHNRPNGESQSSLPRQSSMVRSVRRLQFAVNGHRSHGSSMNRICWCIFERWLQTCSPPCSRNLYHWVIPKLTISKLAGAALDSCDQSWLDRCSAVGVAPIPAETTIWLFCQLPCFETLVVGGRPSERI
jgi:hypothetical protein